MSILLPPTSHLPPIRNIALYSPLELLISLKYLRLLYNPEVRGSRRRKTATERETAVKFVENSSNLDSLRQDAFERSYAIKWLTALVSQIEFWQTDITTENNEREALIQNAASLLAICAGTAAAGAVSRDFIFSSHSSSGDLVSIGVRLTDVPLDNPGLDSVGAHTWGGACVLAEAIVDRPAQFELGDHDIRVLELGAGTGLVSLTVAKLVQAMNERDTSSSTGPEVTIVATDYYPSVLVNLEANVRSNFPLLGDRDGDVRISTHPLDWSSFADKGALDSPFDEPFDLILGADIIYESQHAVWIKSCLAKLLRKPHPSLPDSLFHLIIPLRETHTSESDTIDAVFQRGYTGPHLSNIDATQLVILSKETLICDAEHGQDGKDEVIYAYYKIGWDHQ